MAEKPCAPDLRCAGRLWNSDQRKRLAGDLLRPPYLAELLHFGATHLGWSVGGRQARSAWNSFLQSSAFDDVCDAFDPAKEADFVTHLLKAATPRVKETTPGALWTWFDIAWATRQGYVESVFRNRMVNWVSSLTDTYGDPPMRLQSVWIEFWIRRATKAARAFPGNEAFVDHVKRWASDVQDRILALAGQSWTELERELVVNWATSEERLKKSIVIVLRRGVPPALAEDALQDFWVAQGFDGFKGILARYVPEPPIPGADRFLRFLSHALQRDASRRAKKHYDQTRREIPIELGPESNDRTLDSRLVDATSPFDVVVADEIGSVLRRCMLRLSSSEREILSTSVRRSNDEEIAADLDLSKRAVRVLRFRARRHLRELLSTELEARAANQHIGTGDEIEVN